jgi:hypothetical protein
MPPATSTLPKQRCICCNKIIFMGIIRDGIIEIPCKCGTMNTFKVEPRKGVDIKSQEDRPTVRYATR